MIVRFERRCNRATAQNFQRGEGGNARNSLRRGSIDDAHDVGHDAVELEILRRIDGGDARLLQHLCVFRRDDAADHDRDVFEPGALACARPRPSPAEHASPTGSTVRPHARPVRAPLRRSRPASGGCLRRPPPCRRRARAPRSARRRWNGRRGRACRPGMSAVGRACARPGRRRRAARRDRRSRCAAARPTPVGARYSPKLSRRATPHSPVVTPALAQAIEAGMMLRFSCAAARSSFSAAATAFRIAARAPGLEPLDLLGLGLRRHREDGVGRVGERRSPRSPRTG